MIVSRIFLHQQDMRMSVKYVKGIPVLSNVNFGHATPRMALPYGARARVNANTQVIEFI